MHNNSDDELLALLDREAIRELLLRYCRSIDRRDFGALKTLYHEDAVDEHGGMFQGRAHAFIEQLPAIMAPMEVVWHMLGNMLIEVQGDEAEGEIYTLAYHRADLGEGPQDLIVGGRYLDRYRKRDGIWKIQHRRIVMDWNRIGVSLCDWNSALFQGTPCGARQQDDPAAGFFRWLGKSQGRS